MIATRLDIGLLAFALGGSVAAAARAHLNA